MAVVLLLTGYMSVRHIIYCRKTKKGWIILSFAGLVYTSIF